MCKGHAQAFAGHRIGGTVDETLTGEARTRHRVASRSGGRRDAGKTHTKPSRRDTGHEGLRGTQKRRTQDVESSAMQICDVKMANKSMFVHVRSLSLRLRAVGERERIRAASRSSSNSSLSKE